jgi:hypothetical protein
MAIARDLQLVIAVMAAIAGIAGALILPGFWVRIVVLLAGLLIAAYIIGVLPQLLAGVY